MSSNVIVSQTLKQCDISIYNYILVAPLLKAIGLNPKLIIIIMLIL